MPAEAPLHTANEGRSQHAVACSIAVLLVSRQARQRGGDRGCDAEIHVCDPRWQHIGRKFVPLVGAPRPQRGDVEVGGSAHSHASSLHSRARLKGGEDQRSYHPVTTPPHHEFELWMTVSAGRPTAYGALATSSLCCA